MTTPTTQTQSDERPAASLAQAVARCRADAEFLSRLWNILLRAEATLADRNPRCGACGACCDFARTGHRLYVSTGELALLRPSAGPGRLWACPFQVGPRCTARDTRPLGCRTYFCANQFGDWPNEVYERHHADIRRLHDAHGLPYAYVELTAALIELSEAREGAGAHKIFPGGVDSRLDRR